MKGTFTALLPLLLLAAPLTGWAAERLVPAGSLVQCTVSEPKLSSKTTDVGDPVLCQVSHAELYGRSVFPYGSYLVGRFEDYKDPGRLVGKGWMELKFDRMVILPDQVLPVSAKVVYVPKYTVNKQGKIQGNGHPVRDAIEWSIPILWPIDILNLPRRGPRPILKAETRLTLKIMDDMAIPLTQQSTAAPYYPPSSVPPNAYGFAPRAPMSYTPRTVVPSSQPMKYSYASAQPTAPAGQTPAPPPLTVLMLRDGNGRLAQNYWFENGSQIRYIGTNGVPVVIPVELLDLPTTVEINRQSGVAFTIRSTAY